MSKSLVYKINYLVIIILIFLIFGCSANVNVIKCEINVRHENTDIPNGSGYYNFGSVPQNILSKATFTIENTGTEELQLQGSPLIMLENDVTDSFEVNSSETKTRLLPGQSTDFEISFLPATIGEKNAQISIKNNDFNENPYTFKIIGTCSGAEPEINIKQDTTDILSVTGSYDFGTHAVGSTSENVTFTIENKGVGGLLLIGNPDKISIAGNNPSMFNVEQSTVVSPILGSSFTTFNISFNPTSTGVKSAKISILNNDKDENPYTFTVTGTGIDAPEINVKQDGNNILHDTGEYNFGEVFVNESSSDTEFIIENLGSLTLHLSGNPDKIELTGAVSGMFSIIQTSTLVDITPGNSTIFSISFNPMSTGEKTATISIPNNDDDENPYTFTIKGTGIEPEMKIKQSIKNIDNSSGMFDFYRCLIGASSVEITFTIENDGDGILYLTGSQIIKITGSNASEFSINLSQTKEKIDPGSTTTFTITFNPTSQGSKTALITISNNDYDKNPYTFTINGEGTYDNAMGWIGGKQDGWQTGTAPLTTPSSRGFHSPKTVFVDSDGFLYIADGNNHRICKWDNAGNSIGWIGHNKDGWQTTNSPSTSGSDYKSFKSPASVFVDSSGFIYVADSSNHRISKWSSTGIAIGWIGGGSNGWKKTNAPSTDGTDYQSFSYPKGVCVDSTGNIFVGDNLNNRVCKWDSSGNVIGWIGGGSNGWKTGTAPPNGFYYQSFIGAMSVFVDSSGYIFVGDSYNHRICKWSSNGTAVGWIGDSSNGWKTTTASGVSSSDYHSFDSPWGVFVSSSGFIYAADRYNNRICKWDANGNTIGWIGGGNDGWQTYAGPPSYGTDFKSFRYTTSVFCSINGILYIVDSKNNRISKWQE